MIQPRFIAIEGVIGVGKTTLARLLQPHFEAQLLLEVFEENPFLPGFYADRERYAFQTQLFFLLSRYQQQRQALQAQGQRTLISDYTFAKDELFAWLNLKDDELAMYGKVHAALAEKLARPDLIVFLRASHPVLMRRIALRDRPYERDMDPEYIRSLAAAYQAWLSNLEEVPVLTIDTDQIDFLAHEADLAQIREQIEQALARQVPAEAAAGSGLPLGNGDSLATFQRFHRELDAAKGFGGDIFLNYILLAGEMGQVAALLAALRRQVEQKVGEGLPLPQAAEQALQAARASLRGELAELLAYVVRLANDAGIDLEAAYLEKMQRSLQPTGDVSA